MYIFIRICYGADIYPYKWPTGRLVPYAGWPPAAELPLNRNEAQESMTLLETVQYR